MNTKIANRIYIEDPSDEIIEWAKENLKFPNPEYEKKQRMGFWVHLHKSRDPRVSCLNPRKASRDLLQHVSRPDSPTITREQ